MDGMEIDVAPGGTKRKAEDEIEDEKPARRIRVIHLSPTPPLFFSSLKSWGMALEFLFYLLILPLLSGS